MKWNIKSNIMKKTKNAICFFPQKKLDKLILFCFYINLLNK